MVVVGVIGAGLVWGWLLVLFVDQRPVRLRSPKRNAGAAADSSKIVRFLAAFVEKWQTERRPYLNLLAVAIFTAGFAWLIDSLTNATLLIHFFIALIFTFLIHFAWRQQLRQAQKSS